jgi:4'-phosphopantetheinyl transferase
MNLHFNDLLEPAQEASLPQDGPSAGEVHIWSHVLTDSDPFRPHARFVLSTEELTKADAFHFEKDKRLYESGHVFIRRVISRYTGIEPSNLEIISTENHKPVLGNAPFKISFNITHSENIIMLAVGFDVDVGVDAEFIMDDFDTDGFVKSNYHPNERVVFQKLNDQNQTDFFYKIWTLKEAFLKLTGEGINAHLSKIDFSGEKASIKYSKGEPKNLWLYSWKRKDNYICSMACDNIQPELKFFDSVFIEPAINEDFQ